MPISRTGDDAHIGRGRGLPFLEERISRLLRAPPRDGSPGSTKQASDLYFTAAWNTHCNAPPRGKAVRMPAKSKKQQMAAGAALSAKRGKRSQGSLKGASRSMYKSMNQRQLRDIAKTKRRRLPIKKK